MNATLQGMGSRCRSEVGAFQHVEGLECLGQHGMGRPVPKQFLFDAVSQALSELLSVHERGLGLLEYSWDRSREWAMVCRGSPLPSLVNSPSRATGFWSGCCLTGRFKAWVEVMASTPLVLW